MLVIQYIVNTVIDLYIIVLIVSIVLSWLLAFGVVNRHNQLVDTISRLCFSLTEPVLRPIRNVLPSLGGLDLSPIVVFIGLRALQIGLNTYIFRPAVAQGY